MKDIFYNTLLLVEAATQIVFLLVHHPLKPMHELNSLLCLVSLTHYVIVLNAKRNVFVPTSLMVPRKK